MSLQRGLQHAGEAGRTSIHITAQESPKPALPGNGCKAVAQPQLRYHDAISSMLNNMPRPRQATTTKLPTHPATPTARRLQSQHKKATSRSPATLVKQVHHCSRHAAAMRHLVPCHRQHDCQPKGQHIAAGPPELGYPFCREAVGIPGTLVGSMLRGYVTLVTTKDVGLRTQPAAARVLIATPMCYHTWLPGMCP